MYVSFFDLIDSLVDPDLTCYEFSRLYYDFFEELKDKRCTSSGFTGMSELLVFRVVLKLVKSGFQPMNITKDVKRFVRENVWIEQGHGIRLKKSLGEQKSIVPDLAIYENGNIESVISIKTYVVTNEILCDELKKLAHLKILYPQIEVLLLLFSWFQPESLETVQEFAASNKWFHYQSLHDEETKTIGEVLKHVISHKHIK